MAFDFPSSPTQGQQFTPVAGGPTYAWNGYAWDVSSPPVVPGTLVELQRKVLSAGAASVDFTGIDATYDEYEIRWYNVKHTVDGSALCFRVSSDGGVTFKSAANYYISNSYVVPTGANSLAGSGATLQAQGQAGWATAGITPYLGEMKVYRPWDSVQYKYFMQRGVAPGTSEHHHYSGFNAFFGDTAAINAIRFFPFSTTFAQGTFVLYGRSKTPLLNMTPLLPPGSKILIQSQTVGAAVATVDFVMGIDSTYDEYEIHFNGVKFASDQNLGFRISQDAGATWKAGSTDYAWSSTTFGSGGSISDQQSGTGTASVPFSAGIQAGGPGGHGIIRFWRPSIVENHILMWDAVAQAASLNYARSTGCGGFNSTAGVLNGIRFLNYPSGGANIIGGTFNLYGIKK